MCRRPNPVDAAYREAILRVVFALRPVPGATYPFRLPELHVFVQVAGGVGTFALEVELYRMEADPSVEFQFEDRVAGYSFFRGFRTIPFERVGLYEFRLFARMTRTAAGDETPNQHRRLLAGEPRWMEAAE